MRRFTILSVFLLMVSLSQAQVTGGGGQSVSGGPNGAPYAGSGAAVPGSCSPDGLLFFKTTAPIGYQQCTSGVYGSIGSGTVTSVSGTANQITATAGATPVLALANPLTTPGPVNVTGGTLTTDVQPLAVTWTYNAAGTTFGGIKFTLTNTASHSGSYAVQVLSGATPLFQIDPSGNGTFGGSVSTTGPGGGVGSGVEMVEGTIPTGCSATSVGCLYANGDHTIHHVSNAGTEDIVLTASANTAAGIVGKFSSCSGTQYLGADGACHTASGGNLFLDPTQGRWLLIVADPNGTAVRGTPYTAANTNSTGTVSWTNATATSGPLQNFATAGGDNSPAGENFDHIDNFIFGEQLHYVCRGCTLSAVTDVAFFFGLTDATPQNASTRSTGPTGAINIAGFYGCIATTTPVNCNGSANNSNYWCLLRDASTSAYVDSGVAVDTSQHTFEVISAASGASYTFKIDGVAKCGTMSSHVPTSGAASYMTIAATNTKAAAVTVSWSVQFLNSVQ